MIADTDAPPRLPGKGLPVLAYGLSFLGAMLVYFTLHPTGLWLALTIAVPVAALIWMATVVVLIRRARACPTSAAQRTFLRRFIPLMILYVLILSGEAWLHETMPPKGPLAIVLAILPALPLVGVVWAFGRLLVDETDEYLRSLIVRQFLVATGFMLSVTSIWGFLDNFGEVPHVPMYWAFILWCVGLAVGSVVNEMRS